MFSEDWLVLVKGAGDLGTGVAWRLYHAGFPVVITELPDPLVIRRAVADHQPPSKAGRPMRILYATQVGTKPPTIVLFVFFQRYFVKGITAGALKG